MSAEPISSLDEKYIANSIVYDAMTASVTLFLDATTLRDATGSLDREAIRARLDAASWSAPALRKRLRIAPLGLSSAAWVPVERLDLDYHVRFHNGVVSEGLESAEILGGRTVGLLARDHPTWRVLFVELDSGSVALVFSWHHVMGDAGYGIRVMRALFDVEPAPEIRTVSDSQRRELGRAPRSGAELLIHVAGSWWNAHASMSERWNAYRARPLARRFRRLGSRLMRPARDAIIRWRRLGDRVPDRAFRMIQIDLADAQRRAAELGGSLNDVTVAVTINALFEIRPGLDEVALLVPISRRKREANGEARNVMTAVRVSVPAGLELVDVVSVVRSQVRRGAVSHAPVSSAARLGYATMVPSGETERYFGSAPVRALAGWPAGDPHDEIGVLASSYADTMTVAISTFTTTDIDALLSSIASQFVGAREPA